MKLRIKGNSLRLRVSPSEVARLLETGRIEETIHLSSDQNASLTYALEHTSAIPSHNRPLYAAASHRCGFIERSAPVG